MPAPMSAMVYFQRNKRLTLALTAGLILSMMVIAFVGGIVSSVRDSVVTARGYTGRISLVETLTREGVPEEKLRALQDLEYTDKVFPIRQLSTQVPVLVGDTSFPVFVPELEAVPDLAKRMNLHLVTGRLPEKEGEIALSMQVARAKKWTLLQFVGSEVREGESLRGRFQVVGLFDSTPWVAVAAAPPPQSFVPDYLVVPKAEKLEQLNEWLDATIYNPTKVRVINKQSVNDRLNNNFASLWLILSMITFMVTVTNTVVTTLLGYIFVLQRRAELALYLAVGHPFGQVFRRLVLSLFSVFIGGWGVGILLTMAVFWWIRQVYFDPRGLVLQVVNPIVLAFTVPEPIIATVVLSGLIWLLLRRFDYVSTIEGRE